VNDPIFVTPAREDLVGMLCGRAAVIAAGGIEEAVAALGLLAGKNIELRCLLVRTKAPLASLALPKELENRPVALHPSRLGRFQDLVRVLPALRGLNARVYLSADDAQNITSLRILASLGVETVAALEGAVRWDLVTDLMTYALLGIFPHAAMEPFRYIASRYSPQEPAEWEAVYFDDPFTYLHLDEKGRVALTRSHLREGRFIASSPAEVTAEARAAALEERRDSLRTHFLEATRCASCQGWRVCQGRFAARAAEDPSCSAFFVELMDVVDRSRKQQGGKPKEPWQF
jgi:hypothetical protein